jgi:phage recombination protein Bet
MSNIVTATQNAMVAFSDEQVALIKRTVCKDSTDDELKLFLHVSKQSGLDPFAKQIHAVKRYTRNGPVMSIQVGIDGYRLIADRTNKYAGNDDPLYTYKLNNDGIELKQIDSATVAVRKIVGGVVCEFKATAYWDEYYPGDKMGHMWKQRPKGMLGKCAEALALRKAFPAELSGLYTEEEMDKENLQAEDTETVVKEANTIDYNELESMIKSIIVLSKIITSKMSLKEKGLFMVDKLKVSDFSLLKKKKKEELLDIINELKSMVEN